MRRKVIFLKYCLRSIFSFQYKKQILILILMDRVFSLLYFTYSSFGFIFNSRKMFHQVDSLAYLKYTWWHSIPWKIMIIMMDLKVYISINITRMILMINTMDQKSMNKRERANKKTRSISLIRTFRKVLIPHHIVRAQYWYSIINFLSFSLFFSQLGILNILKVFE